MGHFPQAQNKGGAEEWLPRMCSLIFPPQEPDERQPGGRKRGSEGAGVSPSRAEELLEPERELLIPFARGANGPCYTSA